MTIHGKYREHGTFKYWVGMVGGDKKLRFSVLSAPSEKRRSPTMAWGGFDGRDIVIHGGVLGSELTEKLTEWAIELEEARD